MTRVLSSGSPLLHHPLLKTLCSYYRQNVLFCLALGIMGWQTACCSVAGL